MGLINMKLLWMALHRKDAPKMNDISTACEHDKLRNKIVAIMMGIKIQAVIVTVGPQQR